MDLLDLFATSPEEAAEIELPDKILFTELFLGSTITVWVLYLLTASTALQDLQTNAMILHYITLPIVTSLFAGLTFQFFNSLLVVQEAENTTENAQLHYIVLSYTTALITVVFTLFTTVSLSSLVL